MVQQDIQELTPTPHQLDAINGIVKNALKGKDSKLLGVAGSGKSYSLQTIINTLLTKLPPNKTGEPRIYVTSPTHDALINAKSFIEPNDEIEFCTTHSFLKVKMFTDKDTGERYFTQTFKDSLKVPIGKILIIDEVSMVGKNLWKYAKDSKNTLILVGDYNQLNPVKEDVSPSRDYNCATFELTEILRQVGENNDIPTLCSNLSLLNTRVDGNNYSFHTQYFNLIDELVESNGSRKCKFITWWNRTVDEVNLEVRRRIYGNDVKMYEAGETIMVKEKYKTYHNNQEVLVHKADIVDYDFDSTTFKCWLLKTDGEDILTLHKDSLSTFKTQSSKLYRLAKTKKISWKDYWRFKETFAKLAYNHAISTHRSQGKSYDKAIVNVSEMKRNRNLAERKRMVYTALSRSKKHNYII